MNRIIGLGVLGLIVFLVLGCSNPKAANETNFAQAINKSLASQPVCAHNFNFTFYSNDAEIRFDANYPEQILVLDSAPDIINGYQALVKAGVFTAQKSHVSIYQYAYTERGKKTELPATLFTLRPAKNPLKGVTAINLCFANEAVEKINQFTEPGQQMGDGMTSSEVSYTYRYVNIAPWANDPAVQKIWPKIAEMLSNPNKSAKSFLVLTNNGWRPFR
ncbi:MAG: hypothetical protein ACYCSS_10320 [Sulfuriferula sp.]